MSAVNELIMYQPLLVTYAPTFASDTFELDLSLTAFLHATGKHGAEVIRT